MGEIAEMMLNGDLDEETGEWIGPGQGFPRSFARRSRERAESRERQARRKPDGDEGFRDDNGQPISPRQIAWLRIAADGSSMYDGCNLDLATGMFRKLARRGYVQVYEPHNGAHKTKVMATDKGHALLEAGPSA